MCKMSMIILKGEIFMAYTYPDKGDKLTCQLINEFDGRYWEKSEERVLSLALEAVQKLRNERLADGTDKIRLLDLGCGMGRLIGVFLPHVDEIVAAEPDVLRFTGAKAAGIAASLKYKKPVKVVHGDSSVVEGKFDIVLSSHVLQHIQTWTARELIETMSDFVEPGGLLILTTTHTAGETDLFFREEWQDRKRLSTAIDIEQFNAAYSEEGVLPVRMFAAVTITGMAAEAGFELLEISRYHYEGHGSAAEDRSANEAGDYSGARDILYIFTRK